MLKATWGTEWFMYILQRYHATKAKGIQLRQMVVREAIEVEKWALGAYLQYIQTTPRQRLSYHHVNVCFYHCTNVRKVSTYRI